MLSSLAPPAFVNRIDAGLQLAERCAHLKEEHPVVLALVPGGVQVALQVADELGAPIAVVVVEPIEQSRGCTLGAAAETGPAVADSGRATAAGVGRDLLEQLALAASLRARARAQLYSSGPSLVGKSVVLVDDGSADGFAQLAACRAAQKRGAAKVTLASPIVRRATLAILRGEVAACIHVTESSSARIISPYEDGRALTDEDARALLEHAVERGMSGRVA